MGPRVLRGPRGRGVGEEVGRPTWTIRCQSSPPLVSPTGPATSRPSGTSTPTTTPGPSSPLSEGLRGTGASVGGGSSVVPTCLVLEDLPGRILVTAETSDDIGQWTYRLVVSTFLRIFIGLGSPGSLPVLVRGSVYHTLSPDLGSVGRLRGTLRKKSGGFGSKSETTAARIEGRRVFSPPDIGFRTTREEGGGTSGVTMWNIVYDDHGSGWGD